MPTAVVRSYAGFAERNLSAGALRIANTVLVAAIVVVELVIASARKGDYGGADGTTLLWNIIVVNIVSKAGSGENENKEEVLDKHFQC